MTSTVHPPNTVSSEVQNRLQNITSQYNNLAARLRQACTTTRRHIGPHAGLVDRCGGVHYRRPPSYASLFGSQAHLGGFNMVWPTEPMASVFGISPPGATRHADGYLYGDVRSEPVTYQTFDEAHLRPYSQCNWETPWVANSVAPPIQHWFGDYDQAQRCHTSGPGHSRSTADSSVARVPVVMGGDLVRVENGGALERSRAFDKGIIPDGNLHQHCGPMGEHQNQSERQTPPAQLDCAPTERRRSMANCQSHPAALPRPAFQHAHDGPTPSSVQALPLDQALHSSFPQTWCDKSFTSSGSTGDNTGISATPHIQAGEAFPLAATVGNLNAGVCHRQDRPRLRAGNPKSNQVPLTITRRRKITTHSSVAEMALPLHSAKVSPLRIDDIRQRLTEESKHRWDVAWKALYTPPAKLIPPRHCLSIQDAKQLLQDGIITRAPSSEAKGYCHTFTVTEADKGRRRGIFWTEAHNDTVRDAYIPDVPLHHISAYVRHAADECGAIRDLKVAFWQIPLAIEKRAYFRLRDVDGAEYEMCRLPMGHSASVEIQQIVAEAIAGTEVVIPCYRTAGVRLAVWVDGIMISGPWHAVNNALARIDANASKVGATFKEHSSPMHSLEFIGVTFNHRAHTVIVAPKTFSKIAYIQQGQITQYEQLLGRLIFASAVVGLPLARFYWVLKYFKRIFHAVNSGRRLESETITLPDSVAQQLLHWTQHVRVPRVVTQPAHKQDTLFTDASLEGWGAVLCHADGRLAIAGGKWEDKTHTHRDIAVLELRAVQHALQMFTRQLASSESLRIVVDNTSVKAALHRGQARSDKLIPDLQDILTTPTWKSKNISVAYIASLNNPADAISRGKKITLSPRHATTEIKFTQAANTSNGGGRASTCR